MLADLGTALGSFLATYGLAAILVVMLLKEIGLPVPVPSDLIMITAGVQAATGSYGLLELVVAIEVAIVVGGSLHFLLVRGAGRAFVHRAGPYVGLTPARIERATAAIQGRGPLAIILGLNVPGARAGVVVAAGLAGLTYRAVMPAAIAGNTIFYGWHIALGFVAGPSAAALLEGVNLPLMPVLLGLALLGLVVWLALRGRRRAGARPEEATLDSLHSWTEAACPACLAATALQRLSAQRGPASAS